MHLYLSPLCSKQSPVFLYTAELIFSLNPTPHINKQAFIYKVNCVWNFSPGDFVSYIDVSSSCILKFNLCNDGCFSKERSNYFTVSPPPTMTLVAQCLALLASYWCLFQSAVFGEHRYKMRICVHETLWESCQSTTASLLFFFFLPSAQCMLR